jgi:hypothetical protein
MSEVDDFFTIFSERERKEVNLTTMKDHGGATIHLCALTYSEVSRFRLLAQKILATRSLDLLMTIEENDYSKDLDIAEDFLMKSAMCKSDGSKFFKDDAQFIKWKNTIPPQVADEIVHIITDMNYLGYNEFMAESALKEHKKK